MVLDQDDFRRNNRRGSVQVPRLAILFGVIVALLIAAGYIAYTEFRIDVPAKHFAVLTAKTGEDLENSEEVAPDENHKGLQLEVLSEGRYFYNPFFWSWRVYPMIEIPRDKMGVRIRLYGEDLPYGDFLASSEKHKGIIEEVLKPGRYAINGIVIDKETKQEVGTLLAAAEAITWRSLNSGNRKSFPPATRAS